MFGSRFVNFGWCRDKYAIFERGHCYDCGYSETWKGSLYCNKWEKNTSGSDSCGSWMGN